VASRRPAWRPVLAALALALLAPAPGTAQDAAGDAAADAAGDAAQDAEEGQGQAQGQAAAGLAAALDPGAPEGAALTARLDRPFDRYALPVGRYARGAPDARALEGRVIRAAWRLAEPEATTAAVMAGYRERLAALGYAPLFACETEACGGFDFRFAVELLPPPAMLVDAADFAQLSARRAGEAGASHVSVLVSRVLGAVYVQTVAVAPAAPAVPLAPAPRLTDSGAAAAPPLPPGAEEALIERLVGFGHVRLQDLAFEPGSAALTPGSGRALDAAARALAARPELAVLVVGHSDNEGPLSDNVALSRRRAEVVRAALVERGVDGARLEAHGAGFLAPVASNASEAGRALNRRVELVLR